MKITGLSSLIFLAICYCFSIIIINFATRSYLLRRDALLNNVKRRGEYEATGLYDDRMKSERMVGVSPELLGTVRITAGISVRYRRLQD